MTKKTLPPCHPDLAASYKYIGKVFNSLGDYLNSLSCLEKAENIYKMCLPSNHPDLADCCSSIGEVYDNMGKYEKALLLHLNALESEKSFW